MAKAAAPPLWIVAIVVLAWFALSIGLYSVQYPHPPRILPLIPLAVLSLLLACWHFEGFLMAMVFMVPMSLGLTDVGGGLGAALPGEAMLLIAAGGILLMILRGQIDPLPMLMHPLGIVICLQLVWTIVSLLASAHSEISVKFLVARTTYILVYYIGMGALFQRREHIANFVKAHLWGLVPVMGWAIYQLSQYGLSRSFSPAMADPFYDDHTVFGACLAMVLPLAVWVARHDRLRLSARGRNLAWPIVVLVAVTLLLTFSRAAWMGLGVIGGIYGLLRMRLRFRSLVLALVVVAAGAWIGRDAIVAQFQENENISGADVFSTAASVTNVSTDDSNKERINRWACAIRMFQERPWLGFGPGTYERCYGDYQVRSEMTRISTWNGDRGDAHSEYLGVMAEQGLMGLLLLGGLFLMSIRIAMRLVYRSHDRKQRALVMAILMGLCTYYFHGFVNDFIDIDKLAVLFWGMMAMLAVQDLRDAQDRRDAGRIRGSGIDGDVGKIGSTAAE